MTTPEPLGRTGLQNVLVPTDFSQGAEHAIGRALLLPVAKGARLHILHVLPDGLPVKVRAKIEARAKHTLDRLLSRARAGMTRRREVTLTSGIIAGAPFVEIIRCSRGMGAQLIVVGRHGVRPIRDMFIGTTAARVARMGDVPVLVVNRKPRQPYRRPLLVTDLGDASHRTFEVALQILGSDVPTINVVHAFDVPFEGFVTLTFSAREKSDYRNDFREKAAAGVSAFLATYKDIDVHWKTAIRAGDARTVILGEVVRQRTDVIAIGTHGRSGMAHALLGSVAEWVLTAAPCDVLVARPVRFSFKRP